MSWRRPRPPTGAVAPPFAVHRSQVFRGQSLTTRSALPAPARHALRKGRDNSDREAAMLRITPTGGDGERALRLEGRLVDPWPAELSAAWREAAAGGRRVVLDL